MSHPCPTCGEVHTATMAVAVGRFRPEGPEGYRAAPDGPLRATRAEAVADACARLAAHRHPDGTRPARAAA